MKYIDLDVIDAIDPVEFRARDPYPWANPKGVLTEAGRALLCGQLPEIERFKRVFGKQRKYGQKSHDRFALDYDRGLDVAVEWHEFVEELESDAYRERVEHFLGTKKYLQSYHWHFTPRGCSVSPHCDATRKLGSHIFYLNGDEWDESWGGQTLILDDGGRHSARSNPDFEDFEVVAESVADERHSLIFARNGNSWHGVREITAPVDVYRKVFIVVYDRNGPLERAARLLGKGRGGY